MTSKKTLGLSLLLAILAGLVYCASVALGGNERVGHFDLVEYLSGVYKTTVRAGTLAGDTTFTLPTTNGTSSYILRTDGAGAASWVDTISTIHVADASHNGYLSSGDWSTFNGKLTSPLTTAGDTLYGGVAGVATRLPAGSPTTLLHSGTTPSWSAVSLTADVSGTLPVANGGTGVTSSTGSGSNVLSSGPTLVGPLLGTPLSGVMTNVTGLPLTSGVIGILPVANGGTALASGTSGGVLAYTASGTLASSGALTANAVVVGGGAGVVPSVVTNNSTGTTKFLTQASSGTPAWNTISSGDITGQVAIANGGTGAATKAAGFDALSPMTTAGDVTYGGASGTGTRLGAGSSTTLLHSGTTPSWSAVSLTADVSGTLPAGNGGTGVTSLGSGVATWLGTPSSANLAAAVTDETGSGALVFGTAPVVTLDNGTGLPISTGVSGLGTGVATFLGTPSSANLATAVTGETGSGALVFGTAPTVSGGLLTGTTVVRTGNDIRFDDDDDSNYVNLGAPSTIGTNRDVNFQDASGTLALVDNNLSVFASTTSAQLAGVISNETGSGALCFATGPQFSTSADFLAGGESRYYNAGNTFYVGFKGGNAAANKIWTLPLVDGSSSQVLSTNGSGTLSWSTVATDSTSQFNVKVGDSGGTAQQTNTSLLGDTTASYTSQAYTVTNATPAVFTVTSHGFNTGDKVYVTVTQNGFTANTTYYVKKIDANTFNLSSTLANAAISTVLASSGSTAGTIIGGGLSPTSGTKGTVTNDSATAGYVGQEIVCARVNSSATSISSNTSTNVLSATCDLTPGDWDVWATTNYNPNTTTSMTSWITAVSATSATLPSTDNIGTPNQSQCEAYQPQTFPANVPGNVAIAGPTVGPYRCSVAQGAVKSLYLVGRTIFSVSTMTVWGEIRARRMR